MNGYEATRAGSAKSNDSGGEVRRFKKQYKEELYD